MAKNHDEPFADKTYLHTFVERETKTQHYGRLLRGKHDSVKGTEHQGCCPPTKNKDGIQIPHAKSI